MENDYNNKVLTYGLADTEYDNNEICARPVTIQSHFLTRDIAIAKSLWIGDYGDIAIKKIACFSSCIANKAKEEINDEIQNADMLYIIADIADEPGMRFFCEAGKIALETEILAIGIVISRFPLKADANAEEFMKIIELAECVDVLIPIPYEKSINELLLYTLKTIIDALSEPTHIALCFSDVKNLFGDAGCANFGVGNARGENKYFKAVENARSNMLLGIPIERANHILISFFCGNDFSPTEFNQDMDKVMGLLSHNPVCFYCATSDDKLGEEVIACIIATNFNVEHKSQETTGKCSGKIFSI